MIPEPVAVQGVPQTVDGRQIAVVADADTAIGRAIAVALVAAGHDVAVLGRDASQLDQLSTTILQRGGRALAIELERRDPEVMNAAADEVEQRLGEIAAWVNIESFGRPPLEDSYIARANGALAAARVMAPRSRGVIVTINSVESFRPSGEHPMEAAESFALRGFMQSLRTDLLRRRRGVHIVNFYLPARNLRPAWGDSAGDDQELQAIGRAVVRAVRGGRQDRFYGLGMWMSVQWARLAPGISDHLMARRLEEGAERHRSAGTAARELGRATAERAREIFELAATP